MSEAFPRLKGFSPKIKKESLKTLESFFRVCALQLVSLRASDAMLQSKCFRVILLCEGLRYEPIARIPDSSMSG